MGEERLTKAERLLGRRDFTLAGKYGKRSTTQGMVLLVRNNRSKGTLGPRLGITVSRKVGKAPLRNRLKRLCREYFRRNKFRFKAGHDYVVIFRKDQKIGRLSDLEARFEFLLRSRKDIKKSPRR